MKSQDHLWFLFLDNRIIIDYVANRTYILKASKTRQIQVNYLLNLRYAFNILRRSALLNTTIYYSIHLISRLPIIYLHTQGSDYPLFRNTCWAPFATCINIFAWIKKNLEKQDVFAGFSDQQCVLLTLETLRILLKRRCAMIKNPFL